MATTSPPTDVKLRSPSTYASSSSSASQPPSLSPSLDWLRRTWSVTHSTLSMWRSARNVRITYTSLPPKPDGTTRLDDLVEYESVNSTGRRKTVRGVDTASVAPLPPSPSSDSALTTTSWDWRGSGLLFFATSHWEILGWGERPLPPGPGGEADGSQVERWAVTWFAPTLFTKEGVDIYSDRKEGLSQETYKLVHEALLGLEARSVAEMVEKDLRPVEIRLPWVEN
ncbi:hypothetical protein SODALDRAFT_326594 [Sodiomyces alkalinus F11]|uniref:Uncharacterized protein n=1 Tax=Sodiomyces alkalinus (strain CBS 110278 / VKM F-3762 / F11) TaxID=1314773 RepID=A0A3N2Q6M1_SODAK|nr:hypothetical protein SODALDRAFT_326594 [Sodiomyces alkalinus F11]ROT42433.1 hypothetical protein SODALDRAFT_326594 [Sodiomyces alkalinus F11]